MTEPDPSPKIGDRIRFRAVTRWGDKPATRTVRALSATGLPLVRFAGWVDFKVHPHEILEVLPARTEGRA